LQAARAVNDALRFLLELAALAGLAIWGWRTGPTGVSVVLAIAAPLAAAAIWGAFVAPKAPRHPGDPWRLLLEALVFGAGTLAFAAAGIGWAAIALGVLAALHLVATFPLGQRRPWASVERG
jgi:membrane protein YdbS with pleckstrin-like domain